MTMRRILDLPISEPDAEALRDFYTEKHKTPDGEWRLTAAQALMLYEATQLRGGIGAISVGGGKTLLSALLPLELGVDPERTLVVSSAGLVKEAADIYPEMAAQFQIPALTYVSSDLISRRQDLFESYEPQLIVIDEIDAFKNPKAARFVRLARYVLKVREERECIVVGLSGTLTRESIEDFAHLVALCLGEQAPVPSTWNEVQRWARCIDASPKLPPKGHDWTRLEPLRAWAEETDETVTLQTRTRRAFRRRFETAPGVVVSTGSSCDLPIHGTHVTFDLPSEVEDAIASLESEDAEYPDGIDLLDPLGIFAKKLQLTQGFYYYFDWPEGPDYEWLSYRSEYAAAIHDFASRRGKALKLETPGLVQSRLIAAAAVSGLEAICGRAPRVVKEMLHKDVSLWIAFKNWLAVLDRPMPPTATAWYDDFVVDRALELAQGRALIWTSHNAVADAFARRGVYVAPKGESPAPGHKVAVVSTHSHARGFNLQHRFHRNVVTCSPGSAGTWEQLLGRTHRQGQTKDVELYVMQHHELLRSLFKNARKKARYIEETIGAPQKITTIKFSHEKI